MITLILDAKRIPDGTTVRKVTGQKTYTLARTIEVYMHDGFGGMDPTPIKTEGVVFLMGEGSINGYADATKFAVDLDDSEALEFLRDIIADEN